MPAVNLSGTAPQPEEENPESTIDFQEEPPQRGRGKTTRLLLYLLALVVVGAGGFFGYQYYFDSPTPPPPARPVQPLAKAPTSPQAASPAPGAPASPALPGGAPTGTGPPPGRPPGSPAKAEGSAKAEGPAAGVAAPSGASASPTPPATAIPGSLAPPVQTPPAKAEAKGSAPAPSELKGSGAPPAVASLPPPQPAPPGTARTGTAPAPGGFSLQLGAMLNEAYAQKLKQRLEQLGYSATVRKGVANVRRHVVTVGDFPDRAAAMELATRLTGQGMRGPVIQSGARYTVEAGTFATEDDAIDLARALQKLNYEPRIQDLQQNTTLYQVRVGNYASREEARSKGSELEGKGFRYFIVKN